MKKVSNFKIYQWFVLPILISLFFLIGNIAVAQESENNKLYGALLKRFVIGSEDNAAYSAAEANTLPSIIGLVISMLLSTLGVIFLLLVIYGGYLWMYSRGNQDEVEKAKDIIIDATIGLAVIVLAYMFTIAIMNSTAAFIIKGII